MQTSRRWFLIIPFCCLQRERNLACCSGQTGLCQDKRCTNLQNHANGVRWADAKDRTCTCLWMTHGIKHGLNNFDSNVLLLCFGLTVNGRLGGERCFILPRPAQDFGPSGDVKVNKLTLHSSLELEETPSPRPLWLFGTPNNFSSSMKCHGWR